MSKEIDDDDEAFLYGSEDEGDNQVAKKQKVEATEGKDQQVTDANKDTQIERQKEGDGDNEDDDNEDDDDDEDDEEDSDSDIEFIIGSEEPKQATETKEESKDKSTTAPSSATAVPEAIDEITDTTQTESIEKEPATTEATITRVPGIELNKVGEYEGNPITSINLQDLKEKPWRQPGSDISEYFNFGFDEFTWTAYCSKQDKLRSDFNPQKVMMSMMPMGLPPMMMNMPGFPPGGLPGQPPIPLPGQPQQQPQIPQSQSVPQPPAVGNDNYNNVPPPPPQDESKNLPPNPNLPRAPRERDQRDRMERESSWGGGNENNYRDRERRTRGRR